MDETIIVKGEPTKAILKVIKDTVRVFEKAVKKHAPLKPTMNIEQYLKDVKFLLLVIKE